MTLVIGVAYVDVVFDGEPGPIAPRFVEAEDPTGASVTLPWIKREDGRWVLRVPISPEAAGPVESVLHEVGMERADQIASGYTPEHDDEHGLEHIVDQARGRLLPQQLRTRDDLVEAAACLVAAIEWMDRVRPSAYPD